MNTIDGVSVFVKVKGSGFRVMECGSRNAECGKHGAFWNVEFGLRLAPLDVLKSNAVVESNTEGTRLVTGFWLLVAGGSSLFPYIFKCIRIVTIDVYFFIITGWWTM